MTPHIKLFVISGSGEPGFPYLVTMRLSRDIEIFVKRREIVVIIKHKRVKRFPSSLFVLLRLGTDKQQVYRRNICCQTESWSTNPCKDILLHHSFNMLIHLTCQ